MTMNLQDVLRVQGDLATHSSMTWTDFDVHDITEIRYMHGLLIKHLQDKQKNEDELEKYHSEQHRQLMQVLANH